MCLSGSGPHTAVWAAWSSVTSVDTCSKCSGVGSTCDSSPGTAWFGHSRWTVFRALASSGAQHAFMPPCAGLSPPPFSRNALTRSASGPVLTNPSPIRPARRAALGAMPET